MKIMPEDSLLQRVRLGRLFDIYGALLTDKQQKCLELYFCDDLSLAEIAAEMDVSRQAVHDIIHRVELILFEYESKLKLLEKEESLQQTLTMMDGLLEAYAVNRDDKKLQDLRKLLNRLENEGR